jgi:IS4 transposase
VSKSTLAHANERRDWRIWADLAQVLIGTARELYRNDEFGVELSHTAYAFDSTTIDLCLSLFPWASFRKTKAAVKAHTLVDKKTGLRCDRTIILSGFYSLRDCPDKLRLRHFVDQDTGKRLRFLTNNHMVPSLTIAQLYRCRWQVELFFRWIKQHLRIKSFFGTSENAVKTQIFIAVSVYVLVAIVKKRLHLEDTSLYTILQILSVSLFEKRRILQALSHQSYTIPEGMCDKQLDLFIH